VKIGEGDDMKRFPPCSLVKLAAWLLLIPLLTACGITLSPVKRKPLEIGLFKTQLPSHSQKMLVRFEDTVPSKPLSETVWDNVSGPFWDVEESQQIGYTQNYLKLAVASAAVGATGGAVAAAVGGGVATGAAIGGAAGAVGGAAAASAQGEALAGC
jgi:hypothetical protein